MFKSPQLKLLRRRVFRKRGWRIHSDRFSDL